MTEVLPDASRVSARRAQTRERLMSAAVGVFAARGITGASVEEICEAAGFTRGAFYSNFADKDALVLALIQADAAQQFDAAERAIAAMKSAAMDEAGVRTGRDEEDLVSHALSAFEILGRTGQEAILVQQDLLLYAAREPALRAPYSCLLDQHAEQFRAVIGDAMAFAELEFTVPTAQAIELLTAAHGHMRLQSLFAGEVNTGILRVLLGAITRPRR